MSAACIFYDICYRYWDFYKILIAMLNVSSWHMYCYSVLDFCFKLMFKMPISSIFLPRLPYVFTFNLNATQQVPLLLQYSIFLPLLLYNHVLVSTPKHIILVLSLWCKQIIYSPMQLSSNSSCEINA